MDIRPHHLPSSDQKLSATTPDDTDFPILNDSLLDPTATPHMSPVIKARRPSNPDAPPAFHAADGEWRSFTFPAGEGRPPQQSPIPAQSGAMRNPMFAPFPPPQQVQFSSPGFWPVNSSSGSCTPTAAGGMDPMTDFSHGSDNTPMPQAPPPPPPHGRTYSYDGLHVDTHQPFFPPAPPAFPGSPQSSKGGWVSASSSDGLEYRPAAPSASEAPRSQTPNLAGAAQIFRRGGDGIRKKNARFEIPAERNLRTIDHLINNTNDESEIKELKQQKRLLRNRQAALDSRQRKKQHTERLEEEKKHYTAVITELEDALSDLKIQEGEWLRAKDGWQTSQQQYQACIDSMLMEKEEMVRRHTLETGELRQKNAILMEQLQRMEGASMGAAAMSAAPSSTGFSADFSDFGELPSAWDDFTTPGRFTIDAEPSPRPADTVLKPAPPHADGPAPEDDKTMASGLLLMLLLCGAWVASRGGASAPLPAIPDDVRAASASLLDDIYRDSGVALDNTPTAPSHPSASSFHTKPEPGSAAQPKATLNSFELAGLSNSPLDVIHRQLTAPTPQQLHEQAFALTPAQYGHITGEDAMMSPPPTAALEPPRRGHKSLSEAMASAVAAAGAKEGGAVETYTRSLMRDRVSTQVLRDFARMVGQQSSGYHPVEGRWNHEPLD